MQLGVSSLSLSVKDIHISKAFYEKLGFSVFAGVLEQKWLIMKNGNTLIGLFQGMFEKNMITFNPGWDENANQLSSYTDIRAIQEKLKESDCSFLSEAEPNSEGPASFMVLDPDGNPILFDQHI